MPRPLISGLTPMRMKRLSLSVSLCSGITCAMAGEDAAARGVITPATAPEFFRRSRRDHLPNKPIPAPSRLDISDDVYFDQRVAGNARSRRHGGAHRRDIAPIVGAVDHIHAVIVFQVVEKDADLQALLQRRAGLSQ